MRSCGRSRRIWQGAPTLAVEVVSPTERATDIEQKIADYLAAHTPLMWIIYPRLKTVHGIRPNQPRDVLRLEQELSDPQLLSGFIVPLKALFD